MTPNIHHAVTSSTGALHDLVIHRAHVFDGHRPLAGLHDVAIRDGTIAAVSPERSRGTSDRLSGAIEIDAVAGWVMPGLIDTHVHVYDVAAVRDSDSMRDFEERTLPDLLEDFLQHGVTTIKSVGDPTIEILKTRHGIASGALRGPQLLATGRGITGRNGHPAATVFAENPWARQRFAAEVVSVSQLRELVHQLADSEVDAVKLLSEGACACHDSPAYVWHNPAFPTAVELVRLPADLLSAGIDTAHDRGLRVTVHTTQQAAAHEAIEARADGLEHGVTVEPITDDSLIESMLGHDVVYTPTLWAHDTAYPHIRGNVAQVAAAGVTVALGSDTFSGRGTFGMNTVEEAELMVAAGMSPVQALVAGTSAAARHCVRPDIGRLAVGKQADLILLAADPTQNISHLRTLAVTIARGEIVVDNRRSMASTPGLDGRR